MMSKSFFLDTCLRTLGVFPVLFFLLLLVPANTYSTERSPQNDYQTEEKDKSIVVAQTLSDDRTETQDERIEQLERKLQSVTEELQELKTQGYPDDRLQSIEDKLSVLAEEIDNIKSAEVVTDSEQMDGSAHAAAHGASKVYLRNKGLSIGGYGELLVGQVREDENNVVDAQRVVLYFGYKFTDRIIFNSEIEFEHATTESNKDGQDGSVSVEFALLDFLLWQEFLGGLFPLF